MSGRRKILITGATGGVGHALAERLAPRHDIVATGRMVEAQAATLLPPGVSYLRVPQDDPMEAGRRLRDGLAALGWGRLDNAVLNAGTGFVSEPDEEPAEKLRHTLDVNLASTIALAHVCHQFLAAARGRLTIIGSTSRRDAPRFSSYAASKAGLHGFARALRSEWRGRVSVQIIHPGPVATALHEKAGHDPGRAVALFLSAGSMAAMLEYAIAQGRSPITLSWLRYIGGEAVFGRRL